MKDIIFLGCFYIMLFIMVMISVNHFIDSYTKPNQICEDSIKFSDNYRG